VNKIFIVDDKDYTYDELLDFINYGSNNVNLSHAVSIIFEFIKKLVSVNVVNVEDLIEKIKSSKNTVDLYTSGTTSKPKKITHTISSLTKNIKVRSEFEFAIWGLTYHPQKMASIQVILQSLYNNSTIVNLFDVTNKEIINRIKNNKITHLSATPTFYKLLLSSNIVFMDVKQVTLGGEGVSSHLINQLNIFFPNSKIKNIYASTEASTIFASNTNKFRIPKKLKEFVKIIDGSLLLHIKLLGVGTSDLKIDGEWYDTLDLVSEFEDGSFEIVGRKNIEINISGYKINPVKVESVINTLPFVINNIVYSKKNSVTGNLLYCDVITNDETISKSEIKKILINSLEKYEVPTIINFVKELKVNESNKIIRK
jgi:acyl-coenzyme A synthetase/AMP-(fatty) acid ligase